jgi:hypothetical protein
MNLGSMMDSVFYLGLIITFVLIILLAYHFKQRVSVLEEKNHTMFEILNNVVKELNIVRTNQMRYIGFDEQPGSLVEGGFSNNIERYENPDATEINSQLDYEDSEEDSDDEESEKDSEDEESEESEEDSDDDSSRVKLITVNDDLSVNEIPPVDNFENSADYNQLPDVDEVDDRNIPEINVSEELIVEKLETPLEESIVQESDDINTDRDYSSHTLPQLKAMVISRGLASNPSKLKKSEVIALLEEGDKA